MTKQNNKFNFWVPVKIEKGMDETQPMRVSGVCSSAAKDTDGETLNPVGYDFRPLLQKGFFNYNHKGNDDPDAIIGEPTDARIIADTNELYVEGYLYPTKKGIETYELAKTLEAHSKTRKLGWSIEGQVLERGSNDPKSPLFKKIIRASITGVAITPMPKNPNTLVQIMKGEYAKPYVENKEENEEEEGALDKSMNTENMAPAMPESVEGKKRPSIDSTRVLKKSDIYEIILSKGYTNDPLQIDKIYHLIQTNHNMSTNSNAITEKAIEQSFKMLDSLIEKGKQSSQMNEDDLDDDLEKGMMNDDDNDGDFEKGLIAECFKCIEAGMDRESTIAHLGAKGVIMDIAELTYLHCTSDASANKDGSPEEAGVPTGDIKAGEIIKGQQGTVLTEEKVQEIVASSMETMINNLGTFIDKKLAPIAGQLEKAQQSTQIYQGKIESLESQLRKAPIARSVTGAATYTERFEKGGNGKEVYSTRSKNDMEALSNRLFIEAERQRAVGRPNSALEKAVANLEISKATDFKAISSDLNTLGIEILP